MSDLTPNRVVEQSNGARIKVSAPPPPTEDDAWEDESDESERSFWSLTGLGAVKVQDAEASGSMLRVQIDEVSARHRAERARMFTLVFVTCVVTSLVFNAAILVLGSEFSLASVAIGGIVGLAVRWGGTTRGRELRQATAVIATYLAVASTWTAWFYDMAVNPHLYVRNLSGDWLETMTGAIWGWQGSPELGVAMAHHTKPFGLATFDIDAALLAVGQSLVFPVVLFQHQIQQGILVGVLAMLLAWHVANPPRTYA